MIQSVSNYYIFTKSLIGYDLIGASVTSIKLYQEKIDLFTAFLQMNLDASKEGREEGRKLFHVDLI